MKSLSRVRLFAVTWTVAYHTPPSMGFSSQEYWSGLPFPSPEDLPEPGIKPGSPALQADALPSKPPGKSIIYISPLLGPPSHLPESHPSRSSQSTELSFLCYTVDSHQLFFFFYTRSIISHNLFFLPLPHCVHMSILYVCVSVPVLQIGSFVPFFQVLHICVDIRNLFFSF